MDINFSIEFTYDQYLGMTDSEREDIYHALYAFFYNQALELGVPQRQIFDYTLRKTIREEAFEFSTILRDFENFYGTDF